MCAVLTLKFRFSLDLTRGRDVQETPTIVGGGVYRVDQNTTFVGSTVSLPKYQPISPNKVQLPLPTNPPPLPKTPPPINQDNSQVVFQITTPEVQVNNTTVSFDPRGEVVRARANEQNENDKPKLTKKEQQLLNKKEKERIKEQKKKDKIIIAEILKDDAERIKREAQVLKERKKEKTKDKKENKGDKSKTTTDKKDNKKGSQPQARAANPLAQQSQPTTNPLAQGPASSSNTLKSNTSSNIAPPPYSGPAVTPSESDTSGNTTFSKPAEGMGGGWDLVSQHRQQVARPVKGPAASVKIDNSKYVVGNLNKEEKDVPGLPRKSLYV